MDPLRPLCCRADSRSATPHLEHRPGSTFAYVRWTANDFGTVISRINILRAVMPGEAFSTMPYVRHGGDILLRLSDWPRVERVHKAIDAVEQLGVDPADACPDYWRQFHNQLASSKPSRAYTVDRHRAWLLRRRIDACRAPAELPQPVSPWRSAPVFRR